MSFKPLTKVTARWLALEGAGTEHLTLEQHSGRITATAIVTGKADGTAFGAWYQLFLDRTWRIRAVSVHLTDCRWFIAKSRTPGEWCDGDGKPIKALSGCTDIDLAATPFTNTTAIRRLNLKRGESATIDTVLLPFDTLEPQPASQHYTCLEAGKRYAYQSLTTGIETELTTDCYGLVTDYPGLFKRLA